LIPSFYCDRPGIPRIGSPRRIIQLANEVVFLYEDISGDPYRVIPTDGRPHCKDKNPSGVETDGPKLLNNDHHGQR